MYSNDERQKRIRIMFQLAPKYGWRCWYCNRELVVPPANRREEQIARTTRRGKRVITSPGVNSPYPHLDHIVSRINGGSDEIGNMALSCARCNYAKGTSPLDEFLEWLDHIRFGDSWCPIRDGAKSDAQREELPLNQ